MTALMPAAFDLDNFNAFRIGLQVQSLGSGGEGSDQFVSVPIPLPLGGWLALTAVGGLVALRRRKAAVA